MTLFSLKHSDNTDSTSSDMVEGWPCESARLGEVKRGAHVGEVKRGGHVGVLARGAGEGVAVYVGHVVGEVNMKNLNVECGASETALDDGSGTKSWILSQILCSITLITEHNSSTLVVNAIT